MLCTPAMQWHGREYRSLLAELTFELQPGIRRRKFHHITLRPFT